MQEDFHTDGQREEAGLGGMGREEERAMASIKKTLPDHTDIEDSAILNPLHGEEAVPRKKVTLMGGDFPLPLSPSKQSIKHLLDPNQKPIRTSGLDCGDLDPFVQSDSFVYLAVSAKPALKGDGATVTEFPARETKLECLLKHVEGTKTHFIQPNPERDVKMAHLGPHKPEEGDFLCTDSFVYLAAPACLLLGPAGSTSYSGRCVNFCCFSDEQISSVYLSIHMCICPPQPCKAADCQGYKKYIFAKSCKEMKALSVALTISNSISSLLVVGGILRVSLKTTDDVKDTGSDSEPCCS